jgi:hypothetical protein
MAKIRRIVDGKVYDTSTATLVALLPCRVGVTDFDWHETGVYLTRKGAWFLAGRGDANSMWAVQVDRNSWNGGSGLRVLSAKEARAWLEGADAQDALLKHFAIEEG